MKMTMIIPRLALLLIVGFLGLGLQNLAITGHWPHTWPYTTVHLAN